MGGVDLADQNWTYYRMAVMPKILKVPDLVPNEHLWC